jgi:hypothetical protein
LVGARPLNEALKGGEFLFSIHRCQSLVTFLRYFCTRIQARR